jgi:hypothetical protein
VLECKNRDINSAEVREGLDLLEPHIKPQWLIPQFRSHLHRDPNVEVDKEGQQQVLLSTVSIAVRFQDGFELIVESGGKERIFTIGDFESMKDPEGEIELIINQIIDNE